MKKSLNHFILPIALSLLLVASGGARNPARQQSKNETRNDSTADRTWSKDVAPIVKQYCLPCHLADNDNPSGLALDSYETMMKGGEHGTPVRAGKPLESNFYRKLLPDPPFGKQMPKKKLKPTDAELKLIYDWIASGAVR